MAMVVEKRVEINGKSFHVTYVNNIPSTGRQHKNKKPTPERGLLRTTRYVPAMGKSAKI